MLIGLLPSLVTDVLSTSHVTRCRLLEFQTVDTETLRFPVTVFMFNSALLLDTGAAKSMLSRRPLTRTEVGETRIRCRTVLGLLTLDIVSFSLCLEISIAILQLDEASSCFVVTFCLPVV